MQNKTNGTKANRKRKLAVIALLAVCIAVLATGTLAYYTAQETAYNVITTGTLSMALHDEKADGEAFPEEGIFGVMPGMQVDKLVYVENDGGVEFWTRISLEKIIVPAQGVEAELNFDHITLDIDTQNWTEQDGYYYYNQPLAPGQMTEKLFTAVTFGPQMGNEYMDAHVEIIVHAQAVQSRNNGDSALTATGWSADDAGNAE